MSPLNWIRFMFWSLVTQWQTAELSHSTAYRKSGGTASW
jgi:hypothetical protein